MPVRVYTCQNDTLLEITCPGSNGHCRNVYLTEIGINKAGCSSDTECATSAAVCSSGSCICPMKYFFDNDNCVESKLHRGSYMSAYALLNLLNELGKRDKMRGLPSILSFFSQ